MVLVMHSQRLFLIIISSCFVALSSSASLPVKAVNLGGWLVTEGWITPWLFDDIPNRQMLDSTQVQLKSLKLNTYISAESGGDSVIVADRTSASGWETFKLWRVDETTFNLRVFQGQFVRVSTQSSRLVAKATNPSASEKFVIIRNSNNPSHVRIRAPNGLFVQAKTTNAVTADYSQEGTNNWGNNDPSVFEVTFVGGQLTGEFQLTNGYGSGAASVLTNHWSTYITEDDFRSMANDKLTAVRIPVGWWIASDQNPPKPFVGGSLQYLDKAFDWAERYNLGVIVDLHAPPGGSQNGNDHSGTRDGTKDWGTDESIDRTVGIIDFLASRYRQRSGLLAIELINEPWAPYVSLDRLTKYYRAGHQAVRKYTPNAYVILSNRLGHADRTELLQFAKDLDKSVIDVHYYNLYSDMFSSMTAQQNVDYVKNDRSKELSSIMVADGPSVFVGEWTGEFGHSGGASQKDYQTFAQAQLEVFGRATFGWAYWSWKNNDAHNHWSLKWMIDKGYISL
ncbi:hypothetical protein LUZ62_077994 [Rhynchospora pubera]|uniref:Mannan endo-1,4-beta-mannosidase n=1 Tax=Rhynchospora pubera TaxID=906938 RepID=A0AAV8DKW0_9POAL|nr:hypothetical protein LUZ62_077994 [Rhynchospora pubera]